ncbi:hypothetical protein P691DRAFT_770592 [Macrolepiota fuliginosa MF-IS2]|uniref:Uncharacterized protein n=1 Tax=Macrolepiota fuliginosa MF-IS2 TaxID=1400762 RepID=A0A9P6CAR2_9AGAR|nr:hypothetical protein P691DRAFT_770592 [Macrolepiota fuliginosa MF-IS2]
MAIQTISSEQAINAARYPFLARPPPQKKKPTQAPPSPPIAITLPLSATVPPSPSLRPYTNHITAWAALVQPGSPAPCSPQRRTSNGSSRRPSITRIGRRSSISHSRAPSGSFASLIHTPTSAQDVDINLAALGYTSVFVHVPPKTPSTPSHLVRTAVSVMKAPATPATASIQPPSPKKTSTSTARTLKRFRSLGLLRSKPKISSAAARTAALPSPTKTTMSIRARADLVSKRKRAKYAHVRPPPPLANEIALMQFAEGGSVESNVRKVMEAQARAAGGNLGVGDVYRDGKGGVWWDQDEEMEYAHLLGGDTEGDAQWIKFSSDSPKSEDDGVSPKTGLVDLAELKRESVSTQDSDLDPRFLILPAEEAQCGPEDIVLSFSVAPKSPFRKHSPIAPGLSVLSLPSRPRRAAKHLRKPEFMIDAAAFGPRSPGVQIRVSPKGSTFTDSARPRTPRTPRSARFSSAFVIPPVSSAGKKKVKRRPAPLKLAPVNAGWKKVEGAARTPASQGVSGSEAGVVGEARREFVDASFAPKPVVHRVAKPTTTTTARPQVKEDHPPRGKIVLASLDPMDDMEWAGMLMGKDVDVDMSVSRNTGSVARKKRLGLGGLFGRK